MKLTRTFGGSDGVPVYYGQHPSRTARIYTIHMMEDRVTCQHTVQAFDYDSAREACRNDHKNVCLYEAARGGYRINLHIKGLD